MSTPPCAGSDDLRLPSRPESGHAGLTPSGNGHSETESGQRMMIGMTHVLDPDALPDDARALMAPLPPYTDVTRSDASFRAFLHGLPGVDQVGAEARAAMLGTRSIKTTSKAWAIDTAISMVDLTTLEGSDTH